MKRWANSALVYGILALVFGVFYREFTKAMGFTGHTALSVVHTHYFALGVLLPLVLLALEKLFLLSESRLAKWFTPCFHVGLNLTMAMMVARGLVQVLLPELSKGLDASISGMAGLGHMALGTGIVLMLVAVKSRVVVAQSKAQNTVSL